MRPQKLYNSYYCNSYYIIIYYYNDKDIDTPKYLNIFSKKINEDNDKMFFQTYRSILITFFYIYIIFISYFVFTKKNNKLLL